MRRRTEPSAAIADHARETGRCPHRVHQLRSRRTISGMHTTSATATLPSGREPAWGVDFAMRWPISILVLLAVSVVTACGGGQSSVSAPTEPAPLSTARVADGGLFVVKADGTGLTRIAGGVDERYFGPAWSPDGRGIAVTRS